MRASVYREAILVASGFCLATVLGWFGSMWALVPTQGMRGPNDSFLKLFLYFSLVLMVVYAGASALGLAVLLAGPQGWRLWAWGAGGFVAGAGLAGLLVTIAMFSTYTSPMFLSAFWLPPLVGLIAMGLVVKKDRRTRDDH